MISIRFRGIIVPTGDEQTLGAAMRAIILLLLAASAASTRIPVVDQHDALEPNFVETNGNVVIA